MSEAISFFTLDSPLKEQDSAGRAHFRIVPSFALFSIQGKQLLQYYENLQQRSMAPASQVTPLIFCLNKFGKRNRLLAMNKASKIGLEMVEFGH
jgi:hypothetical protein